MVSNPKCVVCEPFCGGGGGGGDFGGGVACCARLVPHEKHLYGSLATLLLLPPSNCCPIRCREACMSVVLWMRAWQGDFLSPDAQ
jgi:hypothetical protein